MSQDKPSFNWKITGQAGHGVMLASMLMAKMAKRHGMQAFNYLEYPSLIKGGHQTGQVCADFTCASCQRKKLDVIVIYTQESFAVHKQEITDDTIIIYNSDFEELSEEIKNIYQGRIQQMPLASWAKEITGTTLAANTVSLGVSTLAIGLDPDICKQVIGDAFDSQEIIDKNLAAFDRGYLEASKVIDSKFSITPQEDKNILLNGNEALGLGALSGGLQFYSAYPMTPSTGLLHFLNEHKHKLPIVVKQVEDEIGAIHEAIGASVAGARAMTGSSGGGFALMVEALAFAGGAEIPLVILEGQRTGPATGAPTWTAQSDLSFVLTAGHGIFPKVVLTPGTVEEHFQLAQKAMYLAEKYQLPIVILSDKYILESHQTMPAPDMVFINERQSMVDKSELSADESYLRYLDTESGISKRSIPGQEFGLQLTNSYEHDQWGFATEDAQTIEKSVNKRARKMSLILQELPQPKLIGSDQAEITLVGWGSTINVLRETVKALDKKVNAIHLACMHPFPVESFKQLTSTSQKLIMVEGNVDGQGEAWIKQQTGIGMDDRIRRFDGRPFYAEDLVESLTNLEKNSANSEKKNLMGRLSFTGK